MADLYSRATHYRLALRKALSRTGDDQLFWLTVAAHFAWQGFFGLWAHSELESAVAALAETRRRSYKPTVGRTLHLTSNVLDNGAHTKQILEWLKLLGGDQHVVSSEWLDSQVEGVDYLRYLQLQGATVHLAPPVAPIARLIWLRDTICRLAPERIILHINPSDIIGLTAAVAARPPLLCFSDHADYTFSVGAALADRVLPFRAAGADLAVYFRGVRPEQIRLVPLSVEMKEAAPLTRVALGLPDDCTVSLTVVSLYKLKPAGDWHFGRMLRQLFASAPNHYHLIVGSGPAEVQAEIARAAGSQRLRCLGQRTDIASLLALADFVIEGFPLMGGMFRLNAMQAGRAVVAIMPKEFPTITRLVYDTDAFPADYQLICSSNEEVAATALLLIQDCALRERVGLELQQRYQTLFAPEIVSRAMLSIDQTGDWQPHNPKPTTQDIAGYALRTFTYPPGWGELIFDVGCILRHRPTTHAVNAHTARLWRAVKRRLLPLS
jgi:glycosyltransferase involved in cell wall biosynthesis